MTRPTGARRISRRVGAQRRDCAQVLTLLHYYIVNGPKPYCDAGPPTVADQAWAQLYVALGADPAAVRTLLPR